MAISFTEFKKRRKPEDKKSPLSFAEFKNQRLSGISPLAVSRIDIPESTRRFQAFDRAQLEKERALQERIKRATTILPKQEILRAPTLRERIETSFIARKLGGPEFQLRVAEEKQQREARMRREGRSEVEIERAKTSLTPSQMEFGAFGAVGPLKAITGKQAELLLVKANRLNWQDIADITAGKKVAPAKLEAFKVVSKDKELLQQALRRKPNMSFSDALKLTLQENAEKITEKTASLKKILKKQAEPEKPTPAKLLKEAPELEPLTQEARKYKSAEEFVKAKQPSNLSTQQSGMLDSSLKIAREQNIPITKDGNLVLYHGTQEARMPKVGDDWRVGSYFTSSEQTAKQFAGQGGTGKVKIMKVEVPPYKIFNSGDGTYFSSNETFSVKIVDSKSQLTDIWNKAVKAKPVIFEKPVIKPREFATAKEQLALKRKEFIVGGRGAELEARLSVEEFAREKSNQRVIEGIRNNPFFKKQQDLTDIMGEGFLLEKNGRYIVETAENAKALEQKGYRKIIEIDSLASEAGFERGIDFLEEQLKVMGFPRARSFERRVEQELAEFDPQFTDLKQIVEQVSKEKVPKSRLLIEQAKQSEGLARRKLVVAIRDFFGLTDNELKSINAKDVRLMNQREFDDFLEMVRTKSESLSIRRDALNQLRATLDAKELGKWENMRRAMQLPSIDEMSVEQINQLNAVLSQYKKADEFLTVRQIETIDRTELQGLRTVREVQEHLAKKYNLTREELPPIKPHPWMYDTQLARQHPFYDLLVDKYNVGYLKAAGRVIELERESSQLIREARKSVGKRFQLIPQDKNIVQWLEAETAEREILIQKMTPQETEAALFMDAVFHDYYDWLTKRAIDKQFSSRFEDKYFPHIRRGFLEAWKEDGLFKAFKEAFDQFKQEERTLTILNEKTQDVLPYEKWVRFSVFRTGDLIPTKNAAAAFKVYITALEKARQFDEFIPEMMIYAHSLTPKELTPRGLEMNDSLKRFLRQWINSKKGRVQQQIVRPGSRVDFALRMGVAITRLRDLGLNIPVGIANIFGEQAGNLTMLRKAYPIGVKRLATKQGQSIAKKYENFVGRSVWDRLHEASADIGDDLLTGMYGLFGFSSQESNKIFLLGSMTEQEFANGIISIERLAQLRKLQGKYRVVEGAESIFGKSVEGTVGGQYKKWAVPIITSTASNAKVLATKIKTKGVKAALQSEEGAELFFSVILGTIIAGGAMGYYRHLEEKRDRNFVEDVAYKSIRDALSMVGALNPKFLASFAAPRLSSFITDIGTALEQIILLEKYKTKPGLKGIEALKRIFTPALLRPLLKKDEEKSTSVGDVDFGFDKLFGEIEGAEPIDFGFEKLNLGIE